MTWNPARYEELYYLLHYIEAWGASVLPQNRPGKTQRTPLEIGMVRSFWPECGIMTLYKCSFGLLEPGWQLQFHTFQLSLFTRDNSIFLEFHLSHLGGFKLPVLLLQFSHLQIKAGILYLHDISVSCHPNFPPVKYTHFSTLFAHNIFFPCQ